MVAGGDSLYFGTRGSDLVTYFYPNRVFVHRWLARGVWPMWNPHVFGGYPVLESQQMALLNPLSYATARWLPPIAGLAWFTAINLVLAVAVSMASLRRWWRLTPAASAVGALTFVFGAAWSTRVYAGHVTVVAATAWWMPALLGMFAVGWLIRVGAGEPGERWTKWTGWGERPWRALVLPAAIVALCNAMALFSGAPQYVAYLFYMEAVALVAGAGLRRRGLPMLVLAFGGVWMVTALLSAPQWVPTLAYLPFTGRGAGLQTLGAGMHELHYTLAELLLPFPFGNDITDAHLNMKNVWETATYAGVWGSASLLALLASGRLRRDPRARMAIMLAALAVYFFVGGWLPGFSGFREPMKARALLGVAMALSAALMLQMIMAGARLRRRSGRRAWMGRNVVAVAGAAVGVVTLAGLFLAALAVANPGRVRDFATSFGMPFDVAGMQRWTAALADPAPVAAAFAAAALRVVAVGLMLLLLLATMRTRQRALRRLMPALIGLIAVADVVSVHIPGFVARHPAGALELPPAYDQFLREETARSRAAGEMPWRITLPGSLSGRAQFIEGLAETGGYDPIMPVDANQRQLLHGMPFRLPSAEKSALADAALGRRLDMNHTPPDATPALLRTAAGARRSTATLASLERNWVVEKNMDQANSLLGEERRASGEGAGPTIEKPQPNQTTATANPTSSQLISPPPSQSPAGPLNNILSSFGPAYPGTHWLRAFSDSDARHLAILAQQSAAADALTPGITMPDPLTCNRFIVRLDAPSTAPLLAIVRATWLPGWSVRTDVDPRWRAAHRANGWMLGTVLPPGAREATFRYRTPYFLPAVAISVASFFALMAGVWLSRRRPGAATTSN